MSEELTDERLDEMATQFWHCSIYSGRDGQDFDHRAFARALVIAERERCAALCDAIYANEQREPECYGFARECAAAIRAAT